MHRVLRSKLSQKYARCNLCIVPFQQGCTTISLYSEISMIKLQGINFEITKVPFVSKPVFLIKACSYVVTNILEDFQSGPIWYL